MSTGLARYLRKNSTDAEQRLWSLLRSRQLSGCRFRRQHPIGKFIADFACTKLHLIIEADGGQHADNPKDEERTKYLEKQGWKVLRFWNNEILSNAEGVLQVILLELKAASSSLSRTAGEGAERSEADEGMVAAKNDP